MSKTAPAERRRALLNAHFAVENGHNLDGIMRTFGQAGEMIYNRQSFGEAETIRAAHVYIGFGGDGAFADLETIIDAHHLTADEIVVEGRLCGRHVGEFQGIAPTGRAVELPYVGFYRFDADGGLVSERIVMNLGVLVAHA